MSRIRLIVYIGVISITFLSLQTTTFAQFNDYNYKIGLNANYLSAQNEFGGNGFLGRTFLRLQINQLFDAELGAGYGWFSGDDFGGNEYKTNIVPIELRLLFTPFSGDTWNPYLYAGIGGSWWELVTPPLVPPMLPDDKVTDFNFLIPLGLGTEIALSRNLILDASFGWNAIIDDWPNGLKSNEQNLWNHDWDRYVSAGLGITYASDGSCDDEDNDDLSSCDEEEIGTDPQNADTDGDGLKDGEEVMVHNSDPLKIDSNGDGLTDYDKVKNYHLDPNKWDNDGDELSDYDEIKVHNTDPKNPDTDADGLGDGDEVNTYRTNPNKSDTDSDRLNDYEEVFAHKTNPLKKDTDNDMLSDGDEILQYTTNPLMKDTDDGSISDGVEVKRGTDPLNPNDDVAMIEFDDVLFAFDSYKIQKSEVENLKDVLKFMQKNKDVDLYIDGHTDNVGTKEYNQALSEKRAEAVKDWLVRRGVDGSLIFTKGFGFEKPVADNATKEGRRLNRRAEIKVGDIPKNKEASLP